MNIESIIIDYLKSNGYKGLHNEDGCGCRIEDFAPCGEYFADCSPAYAIENPDCQRCENKCEGFDGKNLDYCLTQTKPEVNSSTSTNKESDAITLWREYFAALDTNSVAMFLFHNADRLNAVLA